MKSFYTYKIVLDCLMVSIAGQSYGRRGKMSLLQTILKLIMANPRASANITNMLANSWPIRYAHYHKARKM